MVLGLLLLDGVPPFFCVADTSLPDLLALFVNIF